MLVQRVQARHFPTELWVKAEKCCNGNVHLQGQEGWYKLLGVQRSISFPKFHYRSSRSRQLCLASVLILVWNNASVKKPMWQHTQNGERLSRLKLFRIGGLTPSPRCTRPHLRMPLKNFSSVEKWHHLFLRYYWATIICMKICRTNALFKSNSTNSSMLEGYLNQS